VYSDEFRLPYRVDQRPASDFSVESGRTKLAELRLHARENPVPSFIVPGEDDTCEDFDLGLEAGFTGRCGKILRLSAMIDMDSILSLGCASAVLMYIARRKVQRYLPGDAQADWLFQICAVETFSLENMMQVISESVRSMTLIDRYQVPQCRHSCVLADHGS